MSTPTPDDDDRQHTAPGAAAALPGPAVPQSDDDLWPGNPRPQPTSPQPSGAPASRPSQPDQRAQDAWRNDATATSGQPHGQAPWSTPAAVPGAPTWSVTPPPSTTVYPPYTPPKRRAHIWRLLALAIGLVLLFAGSAVAWSLAQVRVADEGRQADIRQVVAEISRTQDLPLQVDSITTWTSVKAEHDAVHFFYAIDPNFGSSTVSARSIHEHLRPTACRLPAAQEALEDSVELRFTYRFNDTDRLLTVVFDEDDCR